MEGRVRATCLSVLPVDRVPPEVEAGRRERLHLEVAPESRRTPQQVLAAADPRPLATPVARVGAALAAAGDPRAPATPVARVGVAAETQAEARVTPVAAVQVVEAGPRAPVTRAAPAGTAAAQVALPATRAAPLAADRAVAHPSPPADPAPEPVDLQRPVRSLGRSGPASNDHVPSEVERLGLRDLRCPRGSSSLEEGRPRGCCPEPPANETASADPRGRRGKEQKG